MRAGCDVSVRRAYGIPAAFEIEDAQRLAAELGADFELVDADVLAQEDLRTP
ncbi:MAG: hypothetical protein ACLR3C_00700 [Eggerthella lenta]